MRDIKTLEDIFDDDKLGLLTTSSPSQTTEEQRVINKFEDINLFIDKHDREPEGYQSPVEHQLYAQLKVFRTDKKYLDLLIPFDRHNLIHNTTKGKWVLNMTLTKEWFEKVLKVEKTEDYREIKEYWEIRLVGKKYDLVKFVNGYGANRPTIIAKYEGWRYTSEDEKTDLGTGEFFAIVFGDIIETINIEDIT